jgi:hypothetical protein
MKKLKLLTLCLMLFAVVVSCKKEEDTGIDEVVIVDEIVSKEIRDEMEALGLPLNWGNTPPNLEKIFLLSPNILLGSNISSDVIGNKYGDLKIQFAEQDEDLSIKINYTQSVSTGTGIGGIIVGEGNKFTIYAKVTSTRANGTKSDLAQVYSGEITDTGIKDFHYSLFMLDDYGDPNDELIEIGEGRVFHDSDGFSEVITSLLKASEKSGNAEILKSAESK